jgi:hypothetical protein
MPNENCLEGMQCPICDSEGPFKIACTTWLTVHDDGTDDPDGDIEWDDSSGCFCLTYDCSFHGRVEQLRDKRCIMCDEPRVNGTRGLCQACWDKENPDDNS